MKQKRYEMICQELKIHGIIEIDNDKMYLTDKFLNLFIENFKVEGVVAKALILSIIKMLKRAEEKQLKEYFVALQQFEPISGAVRIEQESEQEEAKA